MKIGFSLTAARTMLWLAAIAIATLASENSGATSTDKAVADAYSQFFLSNCHVGLSIAVVRGAQATFYNYGSTTRVREQRPTADSIYEIASVSKTFTGALAAQAIVENRMKLDADFRQYLLPDSYPNLSVQGQPITLRTLAAHRSGLPRDLPDTDDLFAHRNSDTFATQLLARETGYDRARYLRELHAVRLRSQPGSNETYSNLGFKVIGFGLEQVYKTSYEELVKQKILRPLKMESSGFEVTENEQAQLVRGYDGKSRPMPYHLRNAGAAYGLYSTVRDLAKYVRWQLDESDPMIRLAHHPVDGDLTGGKALVWNLALDGDTRLLWHDGGTFGMSSQIVLYPDDRQAVVLLANDSCDGTEGSLKEMAIAIHRALKLKRK